MKNSSLIFQLIITTSVFKILLSQPIIEIEPETLNYSIYPFLDPVQSQSFTILNIGTGDLQGSISLESYYKSYDFENYSGDEFWSESLIEQTNDGNSFLGRFGNESIFYNINNLHNHDSIKIEFDLLVFDSWDGELWSLFVDDSLLFSTNFTYSCPKNNDYDPLICENLNDHYNEDAIFHFEFVIPHNNNVGIIQFQSSTDESVENESWGIDNFEISLLGNMSWLTIDSDSFILNENDSQIFTVSVNTTGLSSYNQYTGRIGITSNDSTALFTTVPVTLNLFSESEINDLMVTPGGDPWTFNEVKLTWTAPIGDTTGSNPSIAYHIRYGNTPDWYSMVEVSNPPSPQDPGSIEEFFIPNLNAGEVYYFAVRAESTNGELGDYNIAIGTPEPNGNMNATISLNNNNWQLIDHLNSSDSLFIQVINGDNPGFDDISILLSSDTESDAETIIITETNAGSGVYRKIVFLEELNIPVIDGTLQVQPGDWVTMTYSDPTNDWGNEEDFSISVPFGGTMVSGSVEGVWDLNGSPYLVDSNISLADGDTLTIEEGVKVIFLDYYNFLTGENSLFEIIGTSALPVVITARTGNFERLYFYDNSNVIINHANISNGGDCIRSRGNITIRNSKFENCSRGIYLEYYGDALIDSSIFLNNTSNGFSSDRSITSEVNLLNSTFVGNNNGIHADGTNLIISNCIFSDNTDNGLYLSDNELIIDISNCLLVENNTGIYSRDGNNSAYTRSISMSAIYNSSNYAINHQTPFTFSAQANYWGENITQIIGENPANNPQQLDIFYDYYDNENYGLVNYSNWLEAPPPTLPGQPEFISSLQVYETSSYENTVPGWVSEEDTLYIQITADPTYQYAKTITGVNLKTSTSNPTGINIALMETDSASGVWRGTAVLGSESNNAFNFLTGIEGEQLMVNWLVNPEENITLDIEGPTLPPTNLTVSNGLSDYIRLDWTAPSESVYGFGNVNINEIEDGRNYAELVNNNRDRELIGYNVYRAIDEEGPFTLLAENVIDVFYLDESAVPANFYFYYVTALFTDPDTESEPSIMVSGIRGTISGIQEQVWDDGSSESAWIWGANSGYAMRFSSNEVFCQVTNVKVHISNFYGNPTSPFEVRIFNSGQYLVKSGIYEAATTGNQWVNVDLTEYNIIINSSDFYVGVFFPSDENGLQPALSFDDNGTFYNRSWSISDWYGWNQETEGNSNYMIRASYTPVAVPHSLYAQSGRDNEVYLSWLSPDQPKIPEIDYFSVGENTVSAIPFTQDFTSEVQRTELSYYNIYRSFTPSGPYELISENIMGNHFLDETAINGFTYYYAITANYEYPNYESPYSEEVSASPTGELEPILYIDDDDNWGWIGGWGLSQIIENSLIHAEIPYDYYATNYNDGPSLEILSQYSIVFWNTTMAGPETGNPTLTYNDINNLISFLDGGGRLFITGMDIGLEINSSALFLDYFSTNFLSSDAGVYNAYGLNEDPISTGISIDFQVSGQNTPDLIESNHESSIPIYEYGESIGTAGIKKNDDNYKIVYLPWDFAQVSSSAFTIADIVYRIWDWLKGIEGPHPFFIADVTQGDSPPLTVQFTDLSTEGDTTMVAWYWDFGDGGTSDEQNPIHTYFNYGTYDVSLTVTDANEISETYTNTSLIAVGSSQISLSSDNISVNLMPNTQSSEIIQIYNTGTLDYSFIVELNRGREPLGRDISGSTIIADIQSYTPGTTIDVQFTIFNNSFDNEWLNEAIISFPDGIIVNSVSDFLGGSGGPLEYISGIGNGAEIYWYGVYANTDWGVVQNQETATSNVNITIMPAFHGDMQLDWTLGGDDYYSLPHEVSGNIIIPELPWFTVSPTQGDIPTGDSLTLNVFFDASGLELGIVKNGSINIVGNSTDIQNIGITLNTVNEGDPIVDFSANPISGYAPLQVSFTDLTQIGGFPLLTWLWDFGDGNTSTEMNPNHTYTEMGDYTVSLTVEDNSGNSITEIKDDYITVILQGYPDVDFTAEPLEGDAPLSVQFQDLTEIRNMFQSAIDEQERILNYSGTIPYQNQTNRLIKVKKNINSIESNREQIPEIINRDLVEISYHDNTPSSAIYQNLGWGIGVVFDLRDYVFPTLEFVDFSHHGWWTLSGPYDYKIHILDWENQTVIDVIENLEASDAFSGATWEESIPLGSIPINSDQIGIFIEPLSGWSTDAYPDISSDASAISSPGVNFIIDINTPFENPTDMYYVDWVGDNFGDFMIDIWIDNGISYSWDFGDDNTSNEMNPNHLYDFPGLYTVSLTVTTSVASITETKENYIQVNGIPPNVDFTSLTTEGTSPLEITFWNVTIEGSYPIDSWSWDFGDGNTSTSQNPTHTYYEVGQYTVSLTASTVEGSITEVKEDYIQVINSPPEEFTLLFPLDQSVIENLVPTFNWEVSSDVDLNDSVYYEFLLGENGNFYFSNLVDSNIHTLQDTLSDNTQYQWMVKAIDNHGEFTESELFTFYTDIFSEPPDFFNLTYPENNATNLPSQITFLWETPYDNDPLDELYYNFTLALDSGLDLVVEETEILETELSITLTDNLQYFWQVTAFDSDSLTSTSSINSFVVNEFNEPPESFDLIYPENGAMGLDTEVNFQWEIPVDNDPFSSLSYNLEIALDNELTNLLIEETELITPEISLTLPDNLILFWRVTAVDNDGLTTVSGINSFTVNEYDEPPNSFTKIFPMHEDQLDSNLVQFVWQSSADNDPADDVDYSLIIYGTNLDTTIFSTESDTTFLLELEMNESYYWNVIAIDNDSLITVADNGNYYTFTLIHLGINNLTIPDKYILSPAYPNPFNPITTINYGVPEISYVSIFVYSIDGKKITRLFNNYQQPGYHSITWNAYRLPSGVYFVRMSAENFTASQKLLLLK